MIWATQAETWTGEGMEKVEVLGRIIADRSDNDFHDDAEGHNTIVYDQAFTYFYILSWGSI